MVFSTRILSFVLGRPGIIRACDTDVPLPKLPVNDLASDGTGDIDEHYQACMTHLTHILEGAKDKVSVKMMKPNQLYNNRHPLVLQCLTVRLQPYDNIKSVDATFEEWEKSLPPYFACRLPDTTLDAVYPQLQLQRYNLAIYYYACRMILHRYLSHMQPSHTIGPPGCETAFDSESNPSRSKCIALAVDLLRTQRSMHPCLRNRTYIQPYFANNFLLFEGAVTLCLALLRDLSNPHAPVWRDEINVAIELLEGLREIDKGDIAQQALLVLGVLKETDAKITGNGRAPSDPPSSISTSSNGSEWVPLFDSSAPFPAATNVQYANVSNALSVPFGWVSDGLGGTVSSFELLHSLGFE